MMAMRYHDSASMIEWAKARIGVSSFRSDARAIGIEGDKGLRAVVVYDGFSDTDCNMHIASDGSRTFLTREALVCWFSYPFIQLKLRRVTGLVPAKNETALKFDVGIGFEYEGLCRHALKDDDLIILGMIREKCRWIPEEYRHA